ncbi:MAG TPA: hypothetical protein VGV17_20000 [Bosea sp. (in: a-proteobacteria)]|uniref:hypothetical protein n=1 Tax=Bosea sp. (in: a-proteobacteria) TaxID=1871050 RepID=UPI002DDD81BC|nr:hypothetical protein [Bosea sp. (in: a-proteobacteria)]HEV2556042.1 hypothetical protein [Bosea sp. (in: a-proteobacteria)]
MPQARHQSSPLLPMLMVAGWALAAAGCAGEAGKTVAEAAGMATTAAEPKPFVQETRPANMAYLPVGTSSAELPLCKADPGPVDLTPATDTDLFGRPVIVPRKPPPPCKPRAEFKAIEAELEAQRAANEAAGTRAQKLGSTPAPKPAALPTN